MIENLNGTHETVNYKESSHMRLYENREIEDFPKHWHIPVEIIMPTVGVYYLDLEDRTITIEKTKLPSSVLVLFTHFAHRLNTSVIVLFSRPIYLCFNLSKS